MSAPCFRVVSAISGMLMKPSSVRLAVLRADTPTKEVRFAEDEWPGAVHLGAIDPDGDPERLIATSSWVPREMAARPGVPAVQDRSQVASLTWAWHRSSGQALYLGATRQRHGPGLGRRDTEVFVKWQTDVDEWRRAF